MFSFFPDPTATAIKRIYRVCGRSFRECDSVQGISPPVLNPTIQFEGSTMPDIITTGPPLGDLESLVAQANSYIARARAVSTVRAYQSDWEDFACWAGAHQLESLPASPQTVALYLTDRASTLAAATLTRRLTSISRQHVRSGLTSPASTRIPVVGDTLRGIKRTIGTAQQRKDPLLSAAIRNIIAASPQTLAGLRDRALLLVGFAAGSRRSELAALTVENVTFCPKGMTVVIARSKTDQNGAGRTIGVVGGRDETTCPVRSLQLWLAEAKITSGPLFRSIDRHGHVSARGLNCGSVAYILKQAARRAGMRVESLGGHSLRAGCVTECASNGVPEYVIMRQTGHTSRQMLDRYIRMGQLFTHNASAGLDI
jgi:integrase